ncbi:MAG TPA: MauE/DoxX family redox-associated membrane protein [Acidimicrobiales bacterium]|nr:MauE/DoxX family redox-associated membrane protein [Acidimicrobiales bacterium]
MALLVARLGLAAVFTAAVAAKLGDHTATRLSTVQFGVPDAIAAPLEWVLLACELAIAVSMIVAWTAATGALGALALLTGYSTAVIASLLRGRAPECHCFGRFSKAPVGWSTVARNGLLGAIAAYIALHGRGSVGFAAIGLLAAGTWTVLAARRSRGRSRGSLAPGFSVPDERGRSWTLEKLLAPRRPVVLVFSHSACGACRAMLPDVAGWQRSLQGRLTIAVLGGGSRLDSLATAASLDPGLDLDLDLDNYIFDESGDIARAYGVTATPSAVLIGRDGRIAASTARGSAEIADLVDDAIAIGDAPRIERRTALGIASLAALPIVGSACSSGKPAVARPKTLHIDGAYICDQKYALCTDAPCVTSTTDPSIVICDCVTKTGYSVGFKSCSEREPKGDSLHSNFSTQLVTSSTLVMTCPADAPWGNCLDVVCTVDPHDASKVQCQCVLVDTGPSLTFGGGCQTKTCTSTIWSAATSNLPGSTQLEKGMKQLGLSLTLPKSCPSS